jgi:hypothetical protein
MGEQAVCIVAYANPLSTLISILEELEKRLHKHH